MTQLAKIIFIDNKLNDRNGKPYASSYGDKQRMKQEITYEIDGAQKKASCFSDVENPLFKPEMARTDGAGRNNKSRKRSVYFL